ncbi:MAG TPA: glycoside hydrolase family 20 zincin-like fold domain-containing protein, partial [Planctomycetota bacterium]|nr:glycoside hydrolase family 20 zincin-like fold domain-containing protein [Planctomycetota bacterium]
IRERWRIDLPVVRENDAGDVTTGVIYLGQPCLGAHARKLAVEEGLTVDAEKPAPQGYGLRVTPARVTVLGRDDDGLYWGVQSLMMAMRWRADDADARSGPAVPSMKVLDWPGTPERAIYMHKGYTSILNVPQDETDRARRILQLLSRFKFNVVYVNAYHGDGGGWAYASYGWQKGTLAKLCREVRADYHIEVRPIMPPSEGMARYWWSDIIKEANDWSMGESDPDEAAPELGGHVNICPLHPKTLPLVLDKIDRTVEAYGYPGTVWLWDQAYIDPKGPGRWAQCRRCQRSGKTPDEIYAWFIRSIVTHLEARQVKARLKSGWLRFGPREEKERRKVALDVRLLPETLRIDLGSAAGLPPGPERTTWETFIGKWLRPERTANGPPGWPSVERVFRGPWTETEVLHSLTGGGITWGGGSGTGTPPAGNLAEACEDLWYAPETRPATRADVADLAVWVNTWWFHTEFPGWRNGVPPGFHPLDLRGFVNHVSHATGVETLQPGHPPEIDLRYLEAGPQTLGGVLFDIIDPAQNDGRGLLMMGRPPDYCPPEVAATVVEKAGPIPVGRRLASIAFLRARWQCALGGMSWHGQWLRPTCRVVYDDGSWLVVDAFSFPHEGHATANWNDYRAGDLYYRAGWVGNTPTGKSVGLVVVEWVNPYPSKTIRELDLFTPDMDDLHGKRVNIMCEAMVAITGVEPTAHDVAFWADRPDRPPLLPPRKQTPTDIVELRVSRPEERLSRDGTWRSRLSGPDGDVPCTGQVIGRRTRDDGGVGLQPLGRYEGVRYQGFEPFGVTLTFEKPTTLARVELIGPTHDWGSLGSYSVRRQKVDVTVEVSHDGEHWRKVDTLLGISAQTDFLPVELPGGPLRALRLTATAAPYHEFYHPTNFWGGMFNRPGSRPHFAWRLFAPKDSKGQDS